MTTPKILLMAWAEANYTPPPSVHTLRRWVRESGIYPAPEKVGRQYYVEPGAIRLIEGAPPRASLLERYIASQEGRMK